MTILTDTARAKVNLTLEVLGRRPDGYHELESLVAFADAADALTLDTVAPEAVHVTGPFGPSLAGENLVAVTLLKAREADPFLTAGAITLDKRLPIAAGIGGGSADAAAVLRLLRRANPGRLSHGDWLSLAKSIGADVPVCFENSAAWMTGIGERLSPCTGFPRLPAVLVNPRVAVPDDKTARVFRALAAPALPVDFSPRVPPSTFGSREDVLGVIARSSNDLLAPALTVVPAIADVLEALRETKDISAALLSGGGPTCCGLYSTTKAASAAATAISTERPSWWVIATELG